MLKPPDKYRFLCNSVDDAIEALDKANKKAEGKLLDLVLTMNKELIADANPA